ncbi:MAG: EAL domain-containing protein [Acidobacteria bacterium]|nr:EAL domain-containing protein [Acidobacteriota bacterium]
MSARRVVATPADVAVRDESLIDPVTALPTVPLLLDRMTASLKEHGYLSILSVNVLQALPVERITGWQAFDSIVKDVGRFLAAVRTVHLRKEDFVSEVMISGNAFVILVAPPRQKQRLMMEDLRRIRDRLDGSLVRFLARRLPSEIFTRFPCFIGCALVENEPLVRSERLVYRALDEAHADSIRERDRLEHRMASNLNEVITSRLVRSVYQPVIDLHGARVAGYEALSRVDGNYFENIDAVFRAAHQSNDLWRLERLCRERALTGASSLPAGNLLFLNVEPESIYDPHFRSDKTLKLLERAGLTPDRVVLEVTEHSAVHDFTAFRQTLAYFRSRGFRLAIDDMGSAYAGLQSVAEIQPDFLKIDISLVRDLHLQPLKRELVATIQRFSASVGIQLIAEGIEKPEELEALLGAGVLMGQGYLFARPGAPFPEPDLSLIQR